MGENYVLDLGTFSFLNKLCLECLFGATAEKSHCPNPMLSNVQPKVIKLQDHVSQICLCLILKLLQNLNGLWLLRKKKKEKFLNNP